MFEHKDQLNRTIRLNERPKRIISLVPSQSEFLWDLGLHEELVGITKFCIHPQQMYKCIERVGGTKNLDLAKIRALKPDLIIGNKEENEKGQIELLQQEFNVWMSDIFTFDDAFDMMKKLGLVFNKEAEANKIIDAVKRSLPAIKNYFPRQKVVYFIWNKPYMGAANHTFIDHVLNYIGLQNGLSHLERYPELDEAVLKKINPDLCFLSSEPFPFKEKHITELRKILPDVNIVIVDGEIFSWYGSRLLNLEKYVLELGKHTILP